jgi:predicted ATP-grasp superfamily ATP-dependent carboligase
VAYASCEEDLLRRISGYAWFPHTSILLQEYVAGEGRGLFCLFDRGEPVVFFAHRRLREKPPSGGVSVLCESSPVPERMRETAEALLRPLDWHGLAMVEFKVAPDGTPYLMEVNARPWGSMQLAIDAGVDFPYLQYCLALGLDLPRNLSYRSGIRSRWLLGDLDRLYLVVKDRSGRYSTIEKGRQLLGFLKFWESSGYDTLQLRDQGPFRAELAAYLHHLIH